MAETDAPLGPFDFPEFLRAFEQLLDVHDAAIVGGQALNFWATYYYPQAPQELARYAPYTSKDIDCYGTKEAAQALASALQGDVLLPGPGDQTPNTAVAVVYLRGRRRTIDFLGGLAGVPDSVIAGDLAAVDLAWAVSEESEVRVRLLHPLPILMSRAGNLVVLRRRDGHAVRQLQASIVVVREYVRDRLAVAADPLAAKTDRDDAQREAVDIARALLTWAMRNRNARSVYQHGLGDPLAALDAVAAHPGWDPRFRDRGLIPRLQDVRARREKRLAEAARKLAGRKT